MPWKARGGRSYYYAAEWVGGRVVYWYIGTGELAWLCSRLALAGRLEREGERYRARAEAEQLAEMDRRSEAVLIRGRRLAEWALGRAGLYRHKGQWRRRRRMSTRAIEPPKAHPPVRPAILIRNAEELALKNVLPMPTAGFSADYESLCERVRQDVRGHAAELAGPDPTPVVRALAVVCGVAWWEWTFAQFSLSSDRSTGNTERWGRIAERAERRYRNALKTLNTVQRNLPSAAIYQQVNIKANVRGR